MTKNLNEMSGPELLAVYNEHTEKPIKRWAKKRSELLARVRALTQSAPKRPGRDGSIRTYCDELLLKVNSVDVKSKRPLGLPYSEILKRVHDRFPGAETSVNCLRWYATKLNNRHRGRNPKAKVLLPERPTASRQKKTAAA